MRFFDDDVDSRAARWLVFVVCAFLAVYVAVAVGRGTYPPHDARRASISAGGAVDREAAGPARANGTAGSVVDTPSGVIAASSWTWDEMADCESGDWDAHGHPIAGTARWGDRRAPYEGGLHFLPSTWLAAGGGRYAAHAYDATREQQISVAASWLRRTSLAQWPVCSRRIGARP